MSKVIKLDGLTIREYVEQRRWDHYHSFDSAAEQDSIILARADGAYAAYQDVLHFLDDVYRPEYLEAVADRIERRKVTGPR